MMQLEGKKIGFAVCGSFCTFSKVMPQFVALRDAGAEVFPIMSEMAYTTDTRFGKSEDFKKYIKDVTGKEIINSVKGAEPIGPKNLLDLLVVLPCTGNTLAKIANGIADTSVTMAVKAHLRNQKPVLLAVSTNDGLGTAAKNIGTLLNCKNLYFLPFSQDDYIKKPNSLVADFEKLPDAAIAAFEGRQLQPVLGF